MDAILEDYATRDFRPKPGTAAVDPATSTGLVAWVTTNGVTNVPASFKLNMRYKNQRFAYREVTGQGVMLAGINDGFVGATPDSGAYELGGTQWTAGVDGVVDLNAPSTVAGRWIFYNSSTFDGNDPAANAADDAAIATDKTALLPGVMAGFANYTSYARGINGIMIDVDHLPGLPLAGDFALRVGNGNPPTWTVPTATPTVSVRTGAGVGGADRITLTWTDNAIHKTWLEITVLATANTGLAAADVFYFGNAIGETGYSNLSDRALVNTSDVGKVRLAVPAVGVPVTNAYDVNRDGRINTSDVGVTRNNTPFVLWLITPPLPPTAGERGVAPSAVVLDQPGLPGLYATATSMFYPRNSTSADASNEAFARFNSESQQRAMDPRAMDRTDLASVVERELGRLGGHNDSDSSAHGLTNAKLPSGIRRQADVLALDAVFARGGIFS